MASVVWADAIKTVSGALKKINKKSQHAQDQKMVLATHRTAPTTSGICSRLFLRDFESVNTKLSQTSLSIAARNRFAAVSAAVKARRQDLTHMVQDQQDFKAQRDLPGGKKTMTSYYWYIMGRQYDQEHNG